ncbi:MULTISPECIES: thioredoxin domain-containing protein [Pseudomonas]|uniref:DsbA family protein n=1 Tax=Pseudomonas TaxID=286 RepID=UPI00224A5B1F|nr:MULTISPECIES: thioredoxin domain-containing protein [unclassified Pseudomonas]MCX2890643.1 thioredoxin domain-containing protein [Pseudomonas sp. DCB_BI]MDH4552599.1 DsbA family protein [Pseudomonas sp. BN607]
MHERMSATNLKWACGWLAAAVLALCWWLPLPFRSTADDGPPRIYGNPEARFTITLYADLECPHCQVYLPQLQRWIVTNDHVNLAWRHLPLPLHEPAASREARRMECVGQPEGREGLWGKVVWIYLHTQGNGRRLASEQDYPDISPSLQRCLAGERAAQVVDTQKAEALETGFNPTPTLRLTDNHTQHTLILEGPIDHDVLLSAVDLLGAAEIFEMPADGISDMPR